MRNKGEIRAESRTGRVLRPLPLPASPSFTKLTGERRVHHTLARGRRTPGNQRPGGRIQHHTRDPTLPLLLGP